jgi:hypothetical protein
MRKLEDARGADGVGREALQPPFSRSKTVNFRSQNSKAGPIHQQSHQFHNKSHALFLVQNVENFTISHLFSEQ